jgi:hypothetical protein
MNALTSTIVGCTRWADPDAFYSQENTPTEHLLKFRSPTSSPLETCGPSASLNYQASVGCSVDFETPGGYAPQPEEVLTDWFNDPRNFVRMRAAWKGLDPAVMLGQEADPWYPLGVEEVFGNRCDFVGALTADQVVNHLKLGRALQACLKDPRHFIAIVAADEARRQFILKDSWGSRWPQRDGFCQRTDWLEFDTKTKPVNLVYYPRCPRG